MTSSPLNYFNSVINSTNQPNIQNKNIELKEASKNGVNRVNGNTPKRRLSYNGQNNTNSTPIMNIENNLNGSTPNGLKFDSPLQNDENQSESSSSTTPFIKRKCIKEQPYVKSNSPYMLSSSNLCNLGETNNGHLNDSMETLQLANNDTISRLPSRSSRILPRRTSLTFSKHKSAPLTSYLNQQLSCTSSESISSSKSSLTDNHQPLNDISNQFNTKLNAQLNKNIKLNDDLSFSDEQKDDITDLENLIFGTNSNHQHQLIKQSLDVDAGNRNLIGDRSKQHILPVINSAKHQDLQCISPETLVDVLNHKYDEQIDEYIIVDSRYPYEFEGGHIKNALNIYTKEKLYEEMFLKRLNYKNTQIHKLQVSASSNCLVKQGGLNGNNHSASNTSLSSMENEEIDLYSSPIETGETKAKRSKDNKRVIIIFHCEFSSERGPTLLRFLRNQDRSLNEHVYPNLFYPELYLLEGGYKSFYENFKNYCDPQTYKPMNHIEHLNDLKHFRAKAKSWEVSRHNYFTKCSDVIQRKQVILNQMAKSGINNGNDQ